ncbi:MAG: sigma-70 family RNA polymerase sigma factor [Clostridia bacterium]
MLEQEETTVLIEKAKQGDKEAKEILINENSPLVKSIIKRFIGKGVEYDDLYQLGCLGFLKAIKNFDTNFNCKFSTYVVPMVIGEIKRYMRDDGSIKVSRAIKTMNMQIQKYIRSYSEQFAEKPSIEQISKQFAIEPEEVVFTMDSARMPISMHTPVSDDVNSTLIVDRLVQENSFESLYDSIIIKDIMQGLEERERIILCLRFFKDKTQGEIAKILKISQVQVSRLENKILTKLKQKLG